MSLRVTIDIFSGRENPVIELTEEEALGYLDRLRPAKRLTKAAAASAGAPALGYRGMTIEQTAPLAEELPSTFQVTAGRLLGPKLSHMAAGPQFEEDVIRAHSEELNAKYGDKFADWLLTGLSSRQEMVRLASLKEILPPPLPVCKPAVCPFKAPLQELTWWNDASTKQSRNNCYNYSTNYRTDSFAQPGRGTGMMYRAMTGPEVLAAAVRDQLINVPTANNVYPPEGHLVALVVSPGYDFHWYRKGRDGNWSHKPGGTRATYLDNSGQIIRDPRTANRGIYTQFVSFLVVNHGHIVLK